MDLAVIISWCCIRVLGCHWLKHDCCFSTFAWSKSSCVVFQVSFLPIKLPLNTKKKNSDVFLWQKFAKMYHNFSYTQVQIVTILDIRLLKSQCQYLFKVYGKGLTSHDTGFFSCINADQSMVDQAINDICIFMQCSRHNLNVVVFCSIVTFFVIFLWFCSWWILAKKTSIWVSDILVLQLIWC